MGKMFTALNAAASMLVGDLFAIEYDPGGGSDETKKLTLANLIASMKASAAEVTTGTSDVKLATPKAIKDAGIIAPVFASIAETTAGTEAAKAVTPDGLSGSGYGKRTVEVMLNGLAALAVTDKGYVHIPAEMNGWNLIAVTAFCVGASSSGTPTFTVKNGATSMLSTNPVIDVGEFSSATGTAAVVDAAHDDVATDSAIEVACSVAGTGTTYASVRLTFQLP